MSIVSILLVAAGAIALAAFTYVTGAESLLSALTRITWWQFVLVCTVYGAGVTVRSRSARSGSRLIACRRST
jgi:uncharacterized membrane protein YbhN (UPF0104 family)